jgi:hypothetical protein
VRASLSDAANLRDFLESALPELVGGLDFKRLKPLPVTFFSDDWRERETDLLFELPYLAEAGTTEVLVCLLMEHQTNTDRLAALRTLLVAGGFWERCWRAWERSSPPRGSLSLPPVIPVVLYTGSAVWGSVTDFEELLAGPPELKRWGPPWRPVFWSLAGRSVEHLLNGGDWLKFLAVVRVEGSEDAEFERVFAEAVRRLAALRQSDHVRWYELLSIVFGYSLFRRPAGQHQALAAVVEANAAERLEEIKTVEKTIAEALMERGELRKARQAVQAVLEERFKALPDELKQRIAAATDLEGLDRALRQAVSIEDPNKLDL